MTAPSPAAAAPPRPAAPWAPALSPRVGTALDLASALVVAAVLLIAFGTFRDYGITWDETWHLHYGDFIVSWFQTLGADTSALCYKYDYLYGGLFDLIGALLRRISPLPPYDTIHLFGALVGALGLVGTWSLARRLAGPAAGFVAVLLLATTPVYYGHIFSNPKDVPFAVGYVWALDALVEVVLRLPRVPRRSWIRFSVLTGMCMGVRVGGILLLAYLAAVVVATAVLRSRATRDLRAGLLLGRRLAVPAAWSILGAWLVMLATWPWALLDPIRRPFMSLGRMSRFTMHRRSMPFAGEELLTIDPRPDYLAHYFGLKLPLFELALMVIAAALVGLVLFRPRVRARLPLAKRNVALVLAAAIMAPPTYAIVVRSVLYDGLRHFLFIVPPMVAVAGVTAVVLPRLVGPRARLAVALGLGLLGTVSLVRQVQAMRALHPYEYVYFNELIGGLPGAYGNYDTDYYGGSYKEGFSALREHLWQTEREDFLDSRYLVTGCIPDFIARNYVGGNFVWIDRGEKGAEFYLGYTRSDCHERYRHKPELLQVQRMDTMLIVVRDLRAPSIYEDGEVPGDEEGEGDTDDMGGEP